MMAAEEVYFAAVAREESEGKPIAVARIRRAGADVLRSRP